MFVNERVGERPRPRWRSFFLSAKCVIVDKILRCRGGSQMRAALCGRYKCRCQMEFLVLIASHRARKKHTSDPSICYVFKKWIRRLMDLALETKTDAFCSLINVQCCCGHLFRRCLSLISSHKDTNGRERQQRHKLWYQLSSFLFVDFP